MGHVASKKTLLDLQQRLDKMPIGTPAHRALFEILAELFTEQECKLASVMPFQLSTSGRIARIAGLSRERTASLLQRMMEKGLVLDLSREGDEPRYYLNPAMIGFFEHTMMKKRPQVDQEKVARLMWEYTCEDPDLAFFRMAAEGPTFLARPLVCEDALEPEVYSEVLDYEKASVIVEEAGDWAEGICHCRHVKLHLGKRCRYPLGLCLCLGMGARALVRAKISKPIDKQRALDVLAHARERGLVQMGDNVKNRLTFICNCCKCCCEMMEGFRTLPRLEKMVTSNYLAHSDPDACTGCGRCARACPVEVIEMVGAGPTEKKPRRKKRAEIDPELCLGCGVCHRKCRSGALEMRITGKRVYTPENVIAKTLAQAVERGKLGNLIFDDHTRLTHRTMSAVLNALIKLPPAKQMLAQEQVKSNFIKLLIEGFKRSPAGRHARGIQ